MKNGILYILSIFLLSGCIVNDIPYPKLLGEITAFSVQGQIGESVINPTDRTVSVVIADTVDIKKVTLLQLEVSNEASIEPAVSKYLNLSVPVKYTLHTYPGQQYDWYIKAEQDLKRFFIVEGEADDAQIDVHQRSVLIQMPLGVELDSLKVLDYKLGPSNSTIFPDPKNVVDYSHAQTFKVTSYGKEEIWTIHAINIKAVPLKVTTQPADAFARRAELLASATQSNTKISFQYKKSGEEAWIDVPQESVSSQARNYSALITGLQPETEYVYYAFSGAKKGEEVKFTTEREAQLPNMSFDAWVKGGAKGKSWFPNENLNEGYFWDTANEGANTISEVNPTKPEEQDLAVPGPGKKAARMVSSKVLVVLAAGNIYSGQFVKRDGMNALIDWGRPFTSRPTSLKGYYKYQPMTIDMAKPPYEDMIGKMDECQIFVALMDWKAPYRVDSGKGNYIDFETDPAVIGYGQLSSSTPMAKYEEFTIDIQYRDRRKASYVILVCVASKYGDYMTGGVGSTLLVDEFEFKY